jgi:glutathione synthase
VTARRLRSLFVMDPFRTVNIFLDTTYRFMFEAQHRGHEVWACRVGDLAARGPRGFAHAKRVEVKAEERRPFEVLERADVAFDDVDVIFMRKDPPFNIGYIFATYLLDAVDPRRTLVVNRPSGLREANEKAFILRFPELTPPTMITQSAADIHAFLDEQGGRCIIKPLDGAGGAGVLLLRRDDPNLTSAIELVSEFGRRYVMCQAYVPEARQGDKRIILIDGEPVGATLRVPQPNELRGNIHVGATCVKSDLTPRDRAICAALAPSLRELGLWFTGIDVLGDYLTEVNVTSPTGIQEINRLDGVCLEATLWDWISQTLSA